MSTRSKSWSLTTPRKARRIRREPGGIAVGVWGDVVLLENEHLLQGALSLEGARFSGHQVLEVPNG